MRSQALVAAGVLAALIATSAQAQASRSWSSPPVEVVVNLIGKDRQAVRGEIEAAVRRVCRAELRYTVAEFSVYGICVDELGHRFLDEAMRKFAAAEGGPSEVKVALARR